jgi:hypothetical protein
MSAELQTNLSMRNYSRFLKEIFSKPIDFFDYFVHSENLSTSSALLLNFILWLYAGVCKLLYNAVVIYLLSRLQEDSEVTIKLTTGLPIVFGLYPSVFLLLTIFHYFKHTYQKKISDTTPVNLTYLSFLPFSASCIFWLLPAPFPFLLIGISFFYSVKLYYDGVLHLEHLDRKHIWNILLLFISFCLFFSFIVLTVFSYLRS